jgi:23S rRNA (adenine2503-C2)-methyltransferase
MDKARQDISGLSLKELAGILNDWQQKPFHAQQIFSWLYQKGIANFEEMSDLPLGLRRRLKEEFDILSLELAARVKSKDDTEKFLFKLKDGNFIEAVIIPVEKRVTACLSTQAGCKFSCRFCASGLLGFKRNLTTAEIVEELLYLKNNFKGKLTHVVFMGIGEPLDNYENVLGAIRIINKAIGLNIAARRITISTAGFVPGIKKLSEEGLQVELSVSLHAADDKTRNKIMPINKIYPLKELIGSCAEYIKNTNRQITFEYVLIKDINSGLDSALKLSKILKGLTLCKVNLIPANTIKELNIEPPNKLEILLFKNKLLKSGIHVTLRKPRGADIDAACGQLRLRYAKKDNKI